MQAEGFSQTSGCCQVDVEFFVLWSTVGVAWFQCELGPL